MRSLGGSPSALRARLPAWLQRFGGAGFLFFLVKGLLWLIAPALFALAGLN